MSVTTTIGTVAQPARKRDDPVAHLLRHLHDASALRSNPIVAEYFVAPDGSEAATARDRAQALRRIQRVVASAVDKLLAHGKGDERAAIHAFRQHAIVRRCDLQRESHAIVAVDLGISRREFYRERKRACERLAEHFERTRSYHTAASVSEFDLQWDIASGFCAAGNYEAAVVAMGKLAATGEAPQRIRAYAGMVPLLCELGRIDDAKKALGAAREVYSVGWPSTSEATLARAEIESAAARFASLSGDLRSALAQHERILGHLHTSSPAPNGRGLELQAVSLIRLGVLKREFGDTRGALQSLALASRALDSLVKPAPLLRAQFLGNLSLSYMVLPGGLAKSAAAMAEYLSYSREHHLMCDTADALGCLSALHRQRGDLDQAKRFARSSLQLASSVSSSHQLVSIIICAAVVEAASSPGTALELISQARALIVPGSFESALVELVASEALLAGDFFAKASDTATAVARVMCEMGVARYAGWALRIAAEAEERLGNRETALRFISEALSALESSNQPLSLASAFACSARLTANKSHAANARDLLADLRRSASEIVT